MSVEAALAGNNLLEPGEIDTTAVICSAGEGPADISK
jgi:hypothetical protein